MDTPTFSMIAYTGGKMSVDGFPHPVVVEFSGLEIPTQNIPIRLDHKAWQGVGHTTKVGIENGELIAEGLISRGTPSAKDVFTSGTKGFPWKASIGGPILECEFVAPGQTAEVNGQKVEGPFHLIRKMTLKEISFVDNAADTNTTAKIEWHATEGITATPPVQTPPTPQTLQAGDIQAYQVNIVAQLREAAVKENARIHAIQKLGGGELVDLEAKAIDEGWSPEKFELHLLRQTRPRETAVPHGEPHRPQLLVLEAAAMQKSCLSLQSIEKMYPEAVLEAAEKYRGIGLQEFCHHAAGVELPRFATHSTEWLRAAFSTSSLPGILSNIANKMLLEGYNYIDETWRKICKIASVNDFKEHSRYRLTSGFTFEKVGEGGELKHGKIGEQKFTQKADTYGIMFSFSRQMIINDDLGALMDIPRQIGMGAGEALTDAIWQLILDNPKQKDGKPFFDEAHKNLLGGADTELKIDGLTNAEIMFSEQTKPNGRPLGIPASILLVPTALKVIAEMLMKSTTVNETTKENDPKPVNNPHTGKYEVVSTPYLSSSAFKNSSSKAWYLFADPNRLPAIEVAFLGGQQNPTVERADADFDTLGIQFRGYLDFGVREQDYRGALKLKGE